MTSSHVSRHTVFEWWNWWQQHRLKKEMIYTEQVKINSKCSGVFMVQKCTDVEYFLS